MVRWGVAHALQRHDRDPVRPPRALQRGALSSSRDLTHWTTPTVIAPNAASPDIVRAPSGAFVVTYQTPSGLAYRTTRDASLRSWSGARPLGRGLASRMIDGALAFTGHGVILGFKAGTTAQHFEIAWAPTLAAPFRIIGQPDISVYDDTVENYEFLTAAGSWHLVATSNTLDQPFIFTLGPGSPSVTVDLAALGRRSGAHDPERVLQFLRRDLERQLRARQFGVSLRGSPG